MCAPRRKRIIVRSSLLLLVGACTLYAASYWLTRVDPQGRFLRELDSCQLIHTDGLFTTGGFPPNAARQVLSKAHSMGVDLFELYSSVAPKSPQRLSLAYLLILSENDAYVRHAAAHGEELFDNHELGVWRYVLFYVYAESGISEAFSNDMWLVLDGIGLTYTQLLMAGKSLAEGKGNDHVAFLLDLMEERLSWGAHAFHLLMKVPPQQRANLLLPLLESDSVRSAHAAYVLALMEEHRGAALDCLNRLKTNESAEIAIAATRVLADLTGVPDP